MLPAQASHDRLAMQLEVSGHDHVVGHQVRPILGVMIVVEEGKCRVLHVARAIVLAGDIDKIKIDDLAIVRYARRHAWTIARIAEVRERQLAIIIEVHHGDGMIEPGKILGHVGAVHLMNH